MERIRSILRKNGGINPPLNFYKIGGKMKIFLVLTKLEGCETINELHGEFISQETAQKYIDKKENPEQFWIEEDKMNASNIMLVDENGWICPMPDDEWDDDEYDDEVELAMQEDFRKALACAIHKKLGIN